MTEFEQEMLKLIHRQTAALEATAQAAKAKRSKGLWERSEDFLKGVREFTYSGL